MSATKDNRLARARHAAPGSPTPNRTTLWRLVLLLLLALVAVPLAADDKKSREERLLKEKLEDLNDLSARLNRYAMHEIDTPEREFVHERVGELLRRARKEPPGYVYERLEDAIEDLLDASDDIGDAFTEKPDKDDDTRERAARDLEQTYFDLQQGRYFAKQSGDSSANDYVRVGKRLYQLARNAYEAGEYAKSRDFASAARELVETLESLAHIAVRIPEPPRL